MLTISYRPLLAALLLAASPAGHGAGSIGTNNNTILGTGAGVSLDTDGSGDDAFNNTLIGTGAGANTTTGDSNTFVGYAAGVLNTIGHDNTFVSQNAGASNTDGFNNTFIGVNAGRNNTSGNGNTFIGRDAGENATGDGNTFIGYLSGDGSSNMGNSNTFLGSLSGRSNTIGGTNTFVGRAAGSNNSSGNANVFLGTGAGFSNSVGHRNVYLGYLAALYESGSDRLYIENSSARDPLIYGEFDNDIVAINDTLGVGTQLPTAPLHVRRADDTAQILVEEAGTGGNANLLTLSKTTGAPFVRYISQFGTWDFTGGFFFSINNPNNGGIEFMQEGDGDLTILGTLTQNSSRASKRDIERVDPEVVLEQVSALPIHRWTYRQDREQARHMGPMAEDFAEAFELGATDTGISTLDSSGVALAAIQGLKAEKDRELAKRDAEIQALKQEKDAEIEALADELADLRKLVESLAANRQVAMVQ